MGYKFLELDLPPEFSAEDINKKIKRTLKLSDFTYSIDKQSLDARNKRNVIWKLRLLVESADLSGEDYQAPCLEIIKKNRDKSAVVVGSGPAGFFAAFVLQKSGFNVTIIERGADVALRSKELANFEKSGEFNPLGNYAFGEGGAGTFSDGKLTSRTKNITLEKKFIFDSYVSAGAPDEIKYLAHPHIGTENLIKVVKNLRETFIADGGKILFETQCTGINKTGDRTTSVETDKGAIAADYFVFAIGHSSYDTYRNLIRSGVQFEVKPFAIGARAEHPQELINKSQWGQASIPGLKAAEYKLTFNDDKLLSVYSFCMCPGGKIVPAAPSAGLNIVNGMSYYRRSSKWANAAIVAGVHLNEFLKRDVAPSEALDWVQDLEEKFFDISGSYAAPFVKISDLLNGKTSQNKPETSYPLGLISADFQELFPAMVLKSLKTALLEFETKIKGYSDGVLMGLESKTSSPIRAVRSREGLAAGFDNTYFSGEGSGYSGGIVSSAADGIKAAMDIIRREG